MLLCRLAYVLAGAVLSLGASLHWVGGGGLVLSNSLVSYVSSGRYSAWRASCTPPGICLVICIILLVLKQFPHKDIKLFPERLDGVVSVLPQLLAVLDLRLQKFS